MPRRGAVVDVGSNTVRLLVGDESGAIHEDGEHLSLGELVARTGRIGEDAIDEAARVVASFVEAARERDAERIAVLVTAPGRLAADGEELVERLLVTSGVVARIVPEDEEARLVFAGAVAAVPDAADPIAVCDVGGGSTELAVGTRADGALWVRSLPVGSANPPRAPFLDGLSPPSAASLLATGGTARSIARLVGAELGATQLAEARKLVETGELVGIPPERVPTLPAGLAILAELQGLYERPLRVADGGFREGALLRLL